MWRERVGARKHILHVLLKGSIRTVSIFLHAWNVYVHQHRDMQRACAFQAAQRFTMLSKKCLFAAWQQWRCSTEVRKLTASVVGGLCNTRATTSKTGAYALKKDTFLLWRQSAHRSAYLRTRTLVKIRNRSLGQLAACLFQWAMRARKYRKICRARSKVDAVTVTSLMKAAWAGWRRVRARRIERMYESLMGRVCLGRRGRSEATNGMYACVDVCV
jgi:hypothetical protein